MECLALVVERLRETAVPRGAGLSWWTPPERLPPHHRARYPRGYYNLGAAHGVPGVVAILAEAVGRGLPARDLLDGAVAWMLTQEIAGSSGPVFPYADADADANADADAPTPTRAAWCYGDPGVAVTLLGAARAVGERGWEERAIAIARRVAARSLAEPDAPDAGLCHGAAGLAHLFNRLYQATDDALLGEAARTWFERTLAMRRPGFGPAGYRACEPDGAQTLWIDDLSLFTGVMGIALALLAATSPVPPSWDSLLLASFPSSVRGER